MILILKHSLECGDLSPLWYSRGARSLSLARSPRLCALRALTKCRQVGALQGVVKDYHIYKACRFFRIFTNEADRNSGNVSPDNSTASASVIAPQLIARRK